MPAALRQSLTDELFVLGGGILKASTLFTPTGIEFRNVLHLISGKPFSIGPFVITP